MKKKLLITFLLCGFTAMLTAQIKIGDNPQNIDAASVLELESTDRVLVITRLNTSQMNAINPNQGAMVYNTDAQCIFYYDGFVWQNLCATGGGNPTDELNTTFAVNAGNLEITDAGGILGVPISAIDTDDQTAAEVTYDNTTSGLLATDTQAAIDEIVAVGGGNPTDELNVTFAVNGANLEITDAGGTLPVPLTDISTDDQTAAEVTYDNATSGLLATDTQAAIDEIAATTGGHTGTTGSIFFADGAGIPSENNSELFWNDTAGNLGIGTNLPNTSSKVHINAGSGNSLLYGLEIQNSDGTDTGGSAAGMLFSVESMSNFGKGALVYERQASWARGDFHFLQNSETNSNTPALNESVLTLKNDGKVGMGTTNPNTDVKVHIREAAGNALFYGLELQNSDGVDTGGSAAGILFSVESVSDFGKGALVYERKASFGRGDFHILQNTVPDTSSPDLLTDAAVTITNDGNVGVGDISPTSTLEVSGSFSVNVRTASAGAINDDDHTVIINTIGTIVLPSASTCSGRIYVLKNIAGANSVIDNYLDSSGTPSTILLPGVTWLQSDGVTWQQIN